MQYRSLRLDQLNFTSSPVRLRRSERMMEELKDSLDATEGPIDPLLGRDLGGDEYIVISGESRLQALLDLNYPLDYEVPCLVGEFEDDQALEYALIENVVRQALTPYEKALAVYRLVNEYGYDRKPLAQKLGENPSYISRLLNVFDLIEPVREALHEGELSLGHAHALHRLVDNPGLQEEALKQVQHHALNVEETRTLVKQLLGEGENWFVKPGKTWLSKQAWVEVQPSASGMQGRVHATTPEEWQQVIDHLSQRMK